MGIFSTNALVALANLIPTACMLPFGMALLCGRNWPFAAAMVAGWHFVLRWGWSINSPNPFDPLCSAVDQVEGNVLYHRELGFLIYGFALLGAAVATAFDLPNIFDAVVLTFPWPSIQWSTFPGKGLDRRRKWSTVFLTAAIVGIALTVVHAFYEKMIVTNVHVAFWASLLIFALVHLIATAIFTTLLFVEQIWLPNIRWAEDRKNIQSFMTHFWLVVKNYAPIVIFYGLGWFVLTLVNLLKPEIDALMFTAIGLFIVYAVIALIYYVFTSTNLFKNFKRSS